MMAEPLAGAGQPMLRRDKRTKFLCMLGEHACTGDKSRFFNKE